MAPEEEERPPSSEESKVHSAVASEEKRLVLSEPIGSALRDLKTLTFSSYNMINRRNGLTVGVTVTSLSFVFTGEEITNRRSCLRSTEACEVQTDWILKKRKERSDNLMKDQFEGDRSSRLHDDDLQQLRQRRLTEPDAVLRIVLCIRVQLNVVAQLCVSLFTS